MKALNFNNEWVPLAILSDMDGLLLDTEAISKRSFDDVAKRYDLRNGDEIFMHLIGLNQAAHQKIFAQLLPKNIDAERYDAEWKQRFLEYLQHDVPLKGGVVNFLNTLRAKEIPAAVGTSSSRQKAENFLKRAGIRDYFITVIGGDDVQHGKPHPDIYLKAAAAIGVAIEDCLVLEDSNNGVLSAVRAGARVIQIPDLSPPSDEISALGHPVLPNLDAVLSYLGW